MTSRQYILPTEAPRKWLKFVAVRGLYEKAVKVCKEVSKYEYYEELELREVIAEPVAFGAGVVTVNGYFRVRTDRDFCPRCGKYGIPDDRLSGLAKDFTAHRIAGYERGRRKIWAKKMAEEEKQRRIKAADNYRHARNIPRCELAARLGIPVAMASDEHLEAKRHQIATLRAIREIKKLTNKSNINENE